MEKISSQEFYDAVLDYLEGDEYNILQDGWLVGLILKPREAVISQNWTDNLEYVEDSIYVHLMEELHDNIPNIIHYEYAGDISSPIQYWYAGLKKKIGGVEFLIDEINKMSKDFGVKNLRNPF